MLIDNREYKTLNEGGNQSCKLTSLIKALCVKSLTQDALRSVIKHAAVTSWVVLRTICRWQSCMMVEVPTSSGRIRTSSESTDFLLMASSALIIYNNKTYNDFDVNYIQFYNNQFYTLTEFDIQDLCWIFFRFL